MKKLFKKLETIMAAAAFAEAGEHDTARKMLKEAEPRQEKRQTRRPTMRPGPRIRVS